MAKALSRAVLFRYDDLHVRQYPIEALSEYEQGVMATYKRDGKVVQCAVGHSYTWSLIAGKWTCGQVEGHTTAVPLFGEADPDAPGDNYAVLLRTHLIADGYSTLRGGGFPWKWFILIGALVIVAFIGYQYLKPATSPASSSPTPTPVQRTLPPVTGP